MGTKYYNWYGSVGPLLHTDDEYVNDQNLHWDGLIAPLQNALITTGQLLVQGYPAEDYNVIRKKDLFYVTNVTLDPGQTDLVVGTDIEDCMIEIILIQAAAAETLENITGAREGNLKFIIPVNDNVSIDRDNTKIKLKQPVANPTLQMLTDDVLVIINFGGDPDTTTDGTWLELYRTLQS